MRRSKPYIDDAPEPIANEGYFSLARGDHGIVTLNGIQVRAVECCVGDAFSNPSPGQEGSGWALCQMNSAGFPCAIDETPDVRNGEIVLERRLGRVTFTPTKK